MITKQMKQQQHMVMTALITILLAVFGSVQNAVGQETDKATVTETKIWDQATGSEKITAITINTKNGGDFANYLKENKGKLPDKYKDVPEISFNGPANATDYADINNLSCEKLNLSQLTFDETDTDFGTSDKRLAALNNIKVTGLRYLALPDAGAQINNPEDQKFTKLYDNNNDLRGVAYYYSAKKAYTCYSKHPGEVYILTDMTLSATGGNQWNKTKQIDTLRIGGNLNAKDISGSSPEYTDAKFDKDGHFEFTSEINESTDPAGNTNITRQFVDEATGDTKHLGFESCTFLTKLDLKNATFDRIEDMTLSKINLLGDQLKYIVIPTDQSITELPADFLHLNSNSPLDSICIPYNIKKIGARAFYGLHNLNHVTTTDAKGKLIDFGYDKEYKLQPLKDEAGKEYQDQVLNPDVTDTQAGSMTFSAKLQEIDSYAFGFASWVKDVYVLAVKAPACHVNAFSSKMYVGNSGYSPNGGITRADFRNSDYWITMLHYPKEIQGLDEEKLYTDVTRDYTITDADGNADGNGNLLHWPNQTEFCRAYEQATNGYLWNAWSTKREAWSNLGSYSLSKNNGSFIMDQKTANEYYTENGKPANTTFYHTSPDGNSDVNGDWQNVTYNNSDEKLYDNDYRGWHQFVLATSFDYKSETPSHNFKAINDNGWWTICVPFDMTKKEVREMFGYRYNAEATGNPHVCEFTGVLRDAEYADNPNTPDKGKIVLKFDRDVYNNVYKEDGKTVDRATKDDDIVINAGVPYLLQPDFETRDGSLYYYPAKQVLQDEKCKAVSQVDLRRDLKKGVVNQVAVDKNGNKTDYTYTFVGNYWQTEMPKYAYFLAWYEKANVATFFWQTKFPAQTLNWNPYTAIIGCNWNKDDQKIFVPSTDKGNIHWYTRHNNDDKTNQSVFTDDSFTTGSGAKANGPENVSIEAAGNTTDGITKVHFGDRTIDIFHGKVYNLNGQYVGDSLEGLPKGIYIAAGKKYVVK